MPQWFGIGRCVVLLMVAFSLASCEREQSLSATEVIVEIDAEESVKLTAGSLRVQVEGSDGVAELAGRVSRLEETLKPIVFPKRVALVPIDGDEKRAFMLTATVFDEEGELLSQARMISGYVAGQVRYAKLLIQGSRCLRVSCSDDRETCATGSCVSATVDVNTLSSDSARATPVDFVSAEGAGPTDSEAAEPITGDAGVEETDGGIVPAEDASQPRVSVGTDAACALCEPDAARARDASGSNPSSDAAMALPDSGRAPNLEAGALDANTADASTDSGTPECLASGACECIGSGDCKRPNAPRCVQGACVACVQASDCNLAAHEVCQNNACIVGPYCGDRMVNQSSEQCDDGNAVNTDACLDCRNAICGDGFVHSGVEVCDPTASGFSSATCTATCAIPWPTCEQDVDCGVEMVCRNKVCEFVGFGPF